MNAVEEIKAATARLDPNQQFELFSWWVDSDVFRQRQLAALKQEITLGLDQLDRGAYQTYTDANLMQLAEDVGRAGTGTFAEGRQWVATMSQYRIAHRARADLDEIWTYIAQDDPDTADRFIRVLVSRFPMLASMPEMGRRREELAPRLRSFPVGNYVIFYRLMDNGVEVARVLHGARDFPTLFE